MPNIYIFYVFMTALFVTLILIPPISHLAVRLGKFDLPDERKIHDGEISRLAGVAIFLAVIFAGVLFLEMDRVVRGFIAGGLIIFATGLYDDLAGLRPRWKLAGEIMAALVAVLVSRVALDSIDIFGYGDLRLGILAIPFTVLGIVGVTNAVNLLDGLDGLAGGVSAIACVSFGLLAYSVGNQQLLMLSAALAGALLGFLKFNTYPARIFMGDSGSLFLGYSLAYCAVQLCSHRGPNVSEVTPLLILVVPIADTLIVMLSRLRSGQPLFSPDNRHIHHRLLGVGFGHKSTVIIIYSLSYLMAIVGLGTARLAGYQQLLILAPILLLLMFLHRWISPELLRRIPQMLSNEPIRQSRGYLLLMQLSENLLCVAKYLVLLLLALSFFIPAVDVYGVEIIAVLLLVLTLLLLVMTRDWANHFLHVTIYGAGAFLLFLMENFGRVAVIGRVPLNMISSLLFLLLVISCGLKFYIDRRSRDLMRSPLEYLLFFIVISVPLLPADFSGQYHLLTVTAKSVILFAVYRMLVVQKARRNRRIILATLLALLVVVVKWAL